MTIGERQYIVGWWVFYRCDDVPSGCITPEMVVEWINEAEDDLMECNKKLAFEYEEYIAR